MYFISCFMKNRSVFVRMLIQISFIFFVVITLTGTSIYFYFYDTLRKETYNSNVEILNQTCHSVEMMLQDVQKMAISLALNTDVKRLLWLPWDMNKEFRVQKNVWQLFNDRLSSSSYIHSIYLYCMKSEKVITDSGADDLSKFFDKKVIQDFIKGNVVSGWVNTRKLEMDDGTDSQTYVISYIQGIPIDGTGRDGIIVINVREELFYDAVVSFNNKWLGNIAIMDLDGNVLSYKDKSMLKKQFGYAEEITTAFKAGRGFFIKDIEGRKHFISYIISDFNGWRYVTMKPASSVFKKSYLVLNATLAISALSLIIGIVLSALVSRRYYNPLKGLVGIISDSIGLADEKKAEQIAISKNEFDFIKDSFNLLIEQNEEFRQKFRDNELILKEHFLLSIILGRNSDQDKIADQLKYYNIDLTMTGFVVMLVYISYKELSGENSAKRENIIRYQIRALCEDTVGKSTKGVVIDQDKNSYIIILNLCHTHSRIEAMEESKKIAARIAEVLKNNMNVNVTAGIGSFYNKISDVHISYSEAVDAINYKKIAGENSIISIDDIAIGHGNHKVILAFENIISQFANELKLGNYQTVSTIVRQAIDELYENKSINYINKSIMLMKFVNAIVTVILSMSGSLDDIFDRNNNPYYELGQLKSFLEIKTWFDGILMKATQYISNKRENKKAEIINKIVEYMHQHYSESITVQMMADYAYLNHSYFCVLFKEVTGKTFVDYLTEIRLQKACMLLKKSSKNISDIASVTGFGSKLNMIRAFKKHVGMTPSELRDHFARQILEADNA